MPFISFESFHPKYMIQCPTANSERCEHVFTHSSKTILFCFWLEKKARATFMLVCAVTALHNHMEYISEDYLLNSLHPVGNYTWGTTFGGTTFDFAQASLLVLLR